MKILGIESSCDETAAAVVENGTKVLSSIVASSEEIHKKHGGIIPEQAAREQVRTIMPVVEEALENAKLKIKNEKLKFKIQNYKNFIDAIAVTVGPGLIGSLLVGVETAKTLAWVWNKPIVPVNHLIAHIYANFLNHKLKATSYEQIFPALCLIVSGGHTELVLMKNHGKFTWLGGTRDDAAGECFDKTARLLGLGYPGGPAIEKAAFKRTVLVKKQGQSLIKKLPRPMIHEDNFDFSFSGLKTAVFRITKKLKEKNKLTRKTHDRGSIRLSKGELAWEIQEAITDVLVEKTLKAAKKYKVKSILIGGGVAANSHLREKMATGCRQPARPVLPVGRQAGGLATKIFIPDKKLCTDNAAIVAGTAYFNYQPVPWQKIKANPSLFFPSS